MKRIIIAIVLFTSTLFFGQNKDKNLFNGTESFDGKSYTKAESNFRVSQSNNEEKEQ